MLLWSFITNNIFTCFLSTKQFFKKTKYIVIYIKTNLIEDN